MMGQAEFSTGEQGRAWSRLSPAERALDGWLRDGLQRRYATPCDDPIPAELLALLDSEAERLDAAADRPN
ncbi:hypothetical protein [Pseudoroseomonas cervicalis]|uniref:hypothetical protein n=1 Tax=Teichococcus cervicalis TaxID=204525 RepID=UPI0022F14F0A|nr:hypothetical protein [Pseudoroseomonas cervicalis]WBV44929.1 hypothetical protein PFY06_17630 [Pseudoroseomonas cervicalis]